MHDDAEDITNKLHGPCALLLTPAQQEKRIYVECTGVVPAKYPLKIKSELFSLLQSAREGKIMRTFLREGARFLQQQGWTLFPWSRSLFLIGIPFWGVFYGILSIQELFLGLPKTWRASHSFIHSNMVIKKSLSGAVSISNAFTIYAVSFREPFSLYTVGFRIPSVLLFHRPVFYISSYRQPLYITTDGTLPSVSLLFIT